LDNSLYRAGDKEIAFSLIAVENKIVGKREQDTDWQEPNKNWKSNSRGTARARYEYNS
jgi:hypothetical protein